MKAKEEFVNKYHWGDFDTYWANDMPLRVYWRGEKIVQLSKAESDVYLSLPREEQDKFFFMIVLKNISPKHLKMIKASYGLSDQRPMPRNTPYLGLLI